MSRKVAIVADPGIDTAFAIAAALHDPSLDVVGLLPTAGNVTPEQATKNAHILLNEIDPPKLPRVGSALPINFEQHGEKLHGPGGLGGVDFPIVLPRQQTPSDELLLELIEANPGELSLLILGPATPVAAAFGRASEAADACERIVFVGGTWHEPGNATAPAEFHFHCDPAAARKVVHCRATVQVIPLDVTRRMLFSPKDLMDLPNPDSRACRFLGKIIPFGIRASANVYGVEGFHLKDVVAVAALSRPGLIDEIEVWLDVEEAGELTRGMSVIDNRPGLSPPPNVFLATDVDVAGVRGYLNEIFGRAT